MASEPWGDPIHPPSPALSNGAITGIVIGAVIGATIIAVVLAVLCTPKFKRSDAKGRGGQNSRSKEYTGTDTYGDRDGSGIAEEMSAEGQKKRRKQKERQKRKDKSDTDSTLNPPVLVSIPAPSVDDKPPSSEDEVS
jgi:hypothetical protein